MTSSLKVHEKELLIISGYILVAGLFLSLGRFSAQKSGSEVSVQEPTIDVSQIYNNLKSSDSQLANSSSTPAVAGETTTTLNCEGKIKGNISSSARIYHVPGGAFYKRTNPEMCFDTEAEAQAAGFRKSKR